MASRPAHPTFLAQRFIKSHPQGEAVEFDAAFAAVTRGSDGNPDPALVDAFEACPQALSVLASRDALARVSEDAIRECMATLPRYDLLKVSGCFNEYMLARSQASARLLLALWHANRDVWERQQVERFTAKKMSKAPVVGGGEPILFRALMLSK